MSPALRVWLLRDVAEHRHMGDVTTLADPTVMNLIETKLPDAAEG